MLKHHTGFKALVTKITAGTFFVNLKFIAAAGLFCILHHFHNTGRIIFLQFPGNMIGHRRKAGIIGPISLHDDFFPCIKIALRDRIDPCAAGQHKIVVCLNLFI
jgi:hypothetical protein